MEDGQDVELGGSLGEIVRGLTEVNGFPELRQLTRNVAQTAGQSLAGTGKWGRVTVEADTLAMRPGEFPTAVLGAVALAV